MKRILVDNRSCEVHTNTISFEQIVELWNDLHKKEQIHIEGNPGMDYQVGQDANIIFPGESVIVSEGMKFNVHPYHNS